MAENALHLATSISIGVLSLAAVAAFGDKKEDCVHMDVQILHILCLCCYLWAHRALFCSRSETAPNGLPSPGSNFRVIFEVTMDFSFSVLGQDKDNLQH